MENKLEDIFREENLKKIIPEYIYKKEQYEIANCIYEILEGEGKLLLESPCGTGKTLAAMIPALLYISETKESVIISTSTITLQNQLMNELLQPLKLLFPDIEMVKLLGRSNYLCLKRASEYIQEGFIPDESIDIINSLRDNNGEFESKNIEFINEDIRSLNCSNEFCENFSCEYFSECFYFKNRKNSKNGNLIIVNHSLYMADTRLKDNGEQNTLPPHQNLIIDEAHKITESLTSSYTISLSINSVYNTGYLLEKLSMKLDDNEKTLRLESFLNDLLHYGEDFFEFLNKRYNKRVNEFIISHVECGRLSQNSTFIEFYGIIKEILKEIWKIENKTSSVFRVMRKIEEISLFLDNLMVNDEDFFFWIRKNKRIEINFSPYSVENIFHDCFSKRLKSIILMSGTLGFKGDFSFFKKQIGLTDSIDLSFYKDFDKNLKRICYISSEIPSPVEEGFYRGLVLKIEEIAQIIEGRILILFTSLSLMRSVSEELRIPLEMAGRKILVQGESGKSEIQERFKRIENSILFASVSFWEGIDLKGNPLRGLIMTKLPFSVPEDPIMKARSEKLKAEGGNPFLDIFVPSAVMRLKQGIGRLIRNENEWGIVSILDSRILKSAYGKLFLDEFRELEIVTEMDKIEEFIARKIN